MGTGGFHVTRRQVLKGLAAALGAAALPGCGGGPPLGDDALPDGAAELDAVARTYFEGDLEAARVVGEAYLNGFDSADEARADLERSFEPVRDIEDAKEVVAELENALLADFEDAAIYSLAGWQLGLTELRVAAIARLTT